MMNQLTEEDTAAAQAMTDVICALSEGNPGAISVMVEGVQSRGLTFWLPFLRTGLRGHLIWMLFSDKCGRDIDRMIAAMLVPCDDWTAYLEDPKR